MNKFLHHCPLEMRKKYYACCNLKKIIDDRKIKILAKEDRDNYNNSHVIELKQDGTIPSMTSLSTYELCTE